MEHERAQSLFISYHDGELTSSDVSALKAHLAHCPECRLAWEGYQAAVSEVSGLLEVEPSPDFSKRVQQTIVRRSRGRFFSESAESGGMGIPIISVILVLAFALLYLLVSATSEVQVIDSKPSDSATTPPSP